MKLNLFICSCATATSIQAAFVPTSPTLTKHHTNLYSSKPNPSNSPLANLQESLPTLKNPLSQTALSSTNKTPSPPTPPPFDPTDPEALIAITKSFIATDFGIQSSLLQDYSTAQKGGRSSILENLNIPAENEQDSPSSLPFYSSSLLSPNFIWISANNLNDGRAGILNKGEYLAAGRFFDLRKSFPDLEYRAHDFRVVFDEAKEYTDVGNGGGGSSGVEEITIRFTTLTTGTFRGQPLRLRSKTIQPNGKIMKCPPTSISITYATRGENAGKIVKLVNDMVIDRGFGNTMGLSGVAGAAVVAGEPPSDWDVYPPLVSLGRIFARPMKMIEERNEDEGYLPPFPESVMIQLAKGVTASNFGLEDTDLLSQDFVYIEPYVGPLDKRGYVELFEGYGVRDAVMDLDYQFQNYRIDPYNPYRVWVDTKARGTRTGPIGSKSTVISNAKYLAPPESMSFTFDNDGFCTRMTAAAPLDPLLGNTGLLGGVYGLLYATETPENPLKTRTFNLLLSRAQKVALKAITKADIDEYRLSDGRIISGNKPVAQLPASSSVSSTLPSPPKLPASVEKAAASSTPFFASPKAKPALSSATKTSESTKPKPIAKAESVALAKTTTAAVTAPPPPKPAAKTDTPIKPKISANPQYPVTDAFSSFFGTSEVTGTSSSSKPVTTPTDAGATSKVEELRKAAADARMEAAEAKQKAADQKAMLEKKVDTSASLVSAAKRSPTLSIFGSSSSSSTSQPKAASKTTLPVSSNTRKKSPTFSLFGSSKGSEPKAQPQKPSSTPKRSPTLSLFRSTPSSDPLLSSTPPVSAKKSPTLSLFGSTSKDSSPKVSDTPKKKSVVKGSAAKKSKTFSLAGVGGGSSPKQPKKKKSRDAKKQITTQKGVTKKDATTFSLFQGAKKSSDDPVKKKDPQPVPSSKSPTFSLFQGAKKSSITPVKKETPRSTRTKSPTLSLFQGAEKQKTESKKAERKKSTTSESKMSSSNSFFGSFFSGSSNGGSDSTKKETVSEKSSPAKSKSSNAGVPPTLKQWKVNSDNTVEGRIYGSNSFRDGETVTTSPIGKKFKISKGSVIQTSSGSKYLLS